MATLKAVYDFSRDSDFLARLEMSVVKLTRYIFDEPVTTALHIQRYNWAKGADRGPAGVAGSLATAIAWDLQDSIGTVTDDEINGSVEAMVNNSFTRA